MSEIARRRATKASKKAQRRAAKQEHRLAARAAAEARQFGVAGEILDRASINRCAVCVEARGLIQLRWNGTPIRVCGGCLSLYFERHFHEDRGKYVYEFKEDRFLARLPQMHVRAASPDDDERLWTELTQRQAEGEEVKGA